MTRLMFGQRPRICGPNPGPGPKEDLARCEITSHGGKRFPTAGPPFGVHPFISQLKQVKAPHHKLSCQSLLETEDLE